MLDRAVPPRRQDRSRHRGQQGPRRGDGRRPVRAGARVAVTSRNIGELQTAAQAIEAHTGNPVFAIEADARDRAKVDASVAAVCDRFGTIDILVNNAGINIRGPILELGDEQWQTVLDINLSGPFYYCRPQER